jgi:hypothetical protein
MIPNKIIAGPTPCTRAIAGNWRADKSVPNMSVRRKPIVDCDDHDQWTKRKTQGKNCSGEDEDLHRR